MKRIARYILFGLLTITMSTPVHAMDTKKVASKSGPSCWERCAMISAAMLTSSMCVTIGFGAHMDIVKKVHNEQYSCLSVWGTNPNIGIFDVRPPLCATDYNLSELATIIDDTFGKSTTLYGQVTACETSVTRKGPVRRITRDCIDKPEELTEEQLYIRNKRSKKKKVD
jgi:hypothetical protein